MTRWAKERPVYFVEEPVITETASTLRLSRDASGVVVVVPEIARDADVETTQRQLVAEFLAPLRDPILWFYTPMMWPLARHVKAQRIVYDCMDELSAFRHAPPELVLRERELMQHASVVFTGGHSLYAAKKHAHHNVHPMPSSVDVAHFAQARHVPEAEDQARLPGPRLGFHGVIDERMDIELIAAIATLNPEWQIVLVGPVVKIDPADLPRLPNIHYMGQRSYAELPHYLAGWDVALLPFARNEATRYISPTKTPEYLAAGKPVVSTSITDVVRPYGERGLVRIADTPETFSAAVRAVLTEDPKQRITQADAFLRTMSWDDTFAAMSQRVIGAQLEAV